MKIRKYLRVPVPIPVKYRIAEQGDEFRSTLIRDISWGGALVVMNPPAPVGSRMIIQFAFSGESVDLELWGTVVRTEKPSDNAPGGVGIEFDLLDEDSRSLIQAMVHEEVISLVKSL